MDYTHTCWGTREAFGPQNVQHRIRISFDLELLRLNGRSPIPSVCLCCCPLSSVNLINISRTRERGFNLNSL